MTHYDALGIASDASAAEVRDAYRSRARRLHPDNAGGSADAMATVNEAYRVLRDPGRRLDYDRELRARSASTSSGSAGSGSGSASRTTTQRPTTPQFSEARLNPLARYQDPPRFPWRFMAALAGLGMIVVLIGVITYQPPTKTPPDNLLEPGSCVIIETNGDAREVNCADRHDALVDRLIPIDEDCPAGTEAHRDHQGMGTACVVRS